MIPKIRYLYLLYTHPKGALVRNSLAFSALMALAPSIALLTIASLFILRDITDLQANLTAIVPENMVNSLIQAGIRATKLNYVPFLVTLGVSLWTASRGFYSSILAFKVFNNAKTNAIMLSVQSFMATILFVVLTAVVIFFNAAIQWLMPNLSFLTNLLISLFFFHVIAATFFIVTSNPLKRYSQIMYGSWAFAFGITLMGSIFFVYINNFTNYTNVYGSMAGFLILILSMYWLSCLIYFCFCVNEWFRLDKKGVLNEYFAENTTFFKKYLPKDE